MVDQEVTIQVPEVRPNKENAARKIAVVGAGPAGLSCAYFLARLGYRPTVFEAEQRPGGMLTQTIPAYRLPRETLAREIRMIEKLGVSIQTNKKMGRDFTLEELRTAGIAMALYPLSASRAAADSSLEVYQAIRQDGTQRNVVGKMQTRAELYDILGYQPPKDNT